MLCEGGVAHCVGVRVCVLLDLRGMRVWMLCECGGLGL